MNIREMIEEREGRILSPSACLSSQSAGRRHPAPPCTVRTVFQHDRDRILHSKSFRRLKYKTQVFLAPEGDHYRTRLTHTLEVSQIARTVARALALNEDLTEAIAMGHDLGHTPFGHAGERVLADLVPDGFHHVLQSVRVVDHLERDGQGLNLTAEVRDGILRHSKGQGPLLEGGPEVLPTTLEGRIVRLADIVAYVNHDLDDAIRGDLVAPGEVPGDLVRRLGADHGRRINTMVTDMIKASLVLDGRDIRMSDDILEAVVELRDWLYANVYQAPGVREDFEKASRILRELFHYFLVHPQELERLGASPRPGESRETGVADFIAGMTDRFAMNLYQRLFLPQPWRIL